MKNLNSRKTLFALYPDLGAPNARVQFGDTFQDTGASGSTYSGNRDILPGCVFVTGGISEDPAGIISGTSGGSSDQLLYSFGNRLRSSAGIYLPSDTSERVWIGFTDASSFSGHLSSSTPVLNYVAFRYSTGASDVAWKAVTDNGSGTPTIVSTGVSVSTTKTQFLGISWDRTASVARFFIDGSIVAEICSTLPAVSIALRYVAGVLQLTSGVRKLHLSSIQIHQSTC